MLNVLFYYNVYIWLLDEALFTNADVDPEYWFCPRMLDAGFHEMMWICNIHNAADDDDDDVGVYLHPFRKRRHY